MEEGSEGGDQMIYTSDDTLTPWAALSKSRAVGSLARRASFRSATSRVLAVSGVWEIYVQVCLFVFFPL